MNRTVRRCFLLGDDPVSGKNFDDRKLWLDEQLIHQTRHFGIDMLCQAILSNHFHLVLRSRPDVVAEWDVSEVTRHLHEISMMPLGIVANLSPKGLADLIAYLESLH